MGIFIIVIKFADVSATQPPTLNIWAKTHRPQKLYNKLKSELLTPTNHYLDTL